MRGLRIAALAAAVLAAGAASGHIVYARTSLHQLVAGADVVAQARISDLNATAAAPNGARRPVVEAELLLVIKGNAQPGAVRFAQHGHGVAPFEGGEEVLLFLLRAEHAGELAEFAAASGLPYVSLQEHDDRWSLAGDRGPGRLAAARGYARIERIADGNARAAEHRKLLAAQLTSPDTRLAASALGDLIVAPDGLLGANQLAPFEVVLASPATTIGVRLGLLAELERRGLVAAGPHWAALLRETRGAERRAALRAAALHPSPEVLGELLQLLQDADAEVASEAALALGAPANLAALGSLAAALDSGAPRVRAATIRALGRIGGAGAGRVLEHAAASHTDPDTRERARAEAALQSLR